MPLIYIIEPEKMVVESATMDVEPEEMFAEQAEVDDEQAESGLGKTGRRSRENSQTLSLATRVTSEQQTGRRSREDSSTQSMATRVTSEQQTGRKSHEVSTRTQILGPYREPFLSAEEGEWIHAAAAEEWPRELTKEEIEARRKWNVLRWTSQWPAAEWRLEQADAKEAYVQGEEPRVEQPLPQARGATEMKPGKSERRGLPESDAGMSVRQGHPEPDPSGIVAKTPPVCVTKPLGRAFG